MKRGLRELPLPRMVCPLAEKQPVAKHFPEPLHREPFGEIAVLANAFGPVLTGILGAWLQSKAGRKVRLKDGDIEVEAQTSHEVKELYNLAVEQRAKQKKDS